MIYITLIFLTILLDQFSKYLVLTYLVPIDSYPLIPGVFNLTYVENRGAAFSLFTNMQPFLIITTLIFVIILSIVLFKIPKKKENRWINLSLACLIGGALGNFIDRLRLDYVIDFLDFHLINFAIFNLADCFVVCGSISLAIALLVNKEFLDKGEKI